MIPHIDSQQNYEVQNGLIDALVNPPKACPLCHKENKTPFPIGHTSLLCEHHRNELLTNNKRLQKAVFAS